MDQKSKKRRWHSKVRTGCNKCKARRIKCDEVHPQCSQCQRSGHSCTYSTPKPRLFEITPGPEFNSDLEKQSFAYFVQEGAAMVTTFQPSAGVFWQQIGPRISHSYPAVKYGMIATGAIQGPLHHTTPRRIVTTRQPEMNSLTLANLTIGMHLASLADPRTAPLEVTLASCLFFTATAIWADKIGAPAVHIGPALRILDEYTNSTYQGIVANKDEVDTVFLPLFQRFAVNACTFADGYPPEHSSRPQNYCLDLDLDIAGSFTTIEVAFECLYTILKCVLRLREGVTMDGILAKVTAALDQFDEALTSLYLHHLGEVEKQAPSGYTFDHDFRHLRLHLTKTRVMLLTIGSDDEAEYDQYRKEFLFILVECKKLLEEERSYIPKQPSNLRTTLGMIPPLFFVATKCRDLTIRLQAVHLLHTAFRAERGWTSCMATSLARFIIDQEHGSPHPSGKADPPRKRIRLEYVKFSSADRSTFIDYWNCSGNQKSLVQGAKIPYTPNPVVERDGVTNEMARKVLHAFGHTGIVLYAPKIACHCVKEAAVNEELCKLIS